jgi:hypothetical protein
MDQATMNRHASVAASPWPHAAWWLLALAVLAGFIAGRAMGGSSGVGALATEPDATATRAAELTEIAQWQTRVAQPVVCTPAPSPTPTETPTPVPTPTLVPPAPMGQELAYAGNWTVVVTGFTAAPPGAAAPGNKLVQVHVRVTNHEAQPRRFRYDDWRLVDSRGRAFLLSITATSELYGPGFVANLAPSLPQDLTLVFEVTGDAGPGFILESAADPAFRVAVVLQQLG